MRRSWPWCLAVVVTLLKWVAPAAAVPTLEFAIPGQTTGSLSYGGLDGPLLGTGIVVTFTTGPWIGTKANTWNFSGGGAISVVGGVDFLSGTDIGTGTTLFSGSWDSATVIKRESAIKIAGGAFGDTKAGGS